MKGIHGYDPIPVYSSLCDCFSFASGTLRGCGGYLPSRLFPAPAVAASAADPGRGVSGPDLRSRDRLPVHVPAMNTENSTDGFAPDRHAHKSQSPDSSPRRCFTTSAVSTRPNDSKTSRRSLPVTSRGQIPYTDIHSVPLSFVSNTGLWRACQTRENGFGRRVLRRAMLSVSERSCFKASSGDHPEFRTTRNRWTLYYPPPHKQVISFCPSKIFLMHSARRKTQNRRRRIDYLVNNSEPFGV